MAAANDVIHLACHGIFEKSKPILSYLDLAAGEGDDGKLMAWEIYTMKIQADLVFMSGCETALGDIDRGDNLLGLARSFLYAGAQSVIGTLWEVRETQALVDLIESFYRDLFAGKSKAEALRQAQIKMIRGEYPSCKQKEKNSCQHPYFWAPFILIGL
jgi:CHAT domain-containing protein